MAKLTVAGRCHWQRLHVFHALTSALPLLGRHPESPAGSAQAGRRVATSTAYLRLDFEDDLRQGHDEALEGDGDVFQHKVRNPHDPQQVK